MNLMKSLFAAVVLLSGIGAHAQATAGVQPSTGGGISRNGRYMTFYSAGFYTEPVESTPEEVPQLKELMNFMNTTPFMSELTKAKYVSKLIPSSARQYFRVKQEKFTPEIRKRLVAEYSTKMKIEEKQIALFAITDTTKNTTYLFPEYYSLKASEQQAILFHQIYLIDKPDAPYADVLEAEMTFQAYIEYTSSPDRLLRWVKTLGRTGDVITAALQTDIKNQSINGLLDQGQFLSVVNLFGRDFFDCKDRGLAFECTAFVIKNAYALSEQYPRSLLIKILVDKINLDELHIDWGFNDIFAICDRNVAWSEWRSAYIDFSPGLYAGTTTYPIRNAESYFSAKLNIFNH